MQRFGDILGQVFRAIAANKLRSFLTMFGIAWGVGSLLVLVGWARFPVRAASQPGEAWQRHDDDVQRDHPRCRQTSTRGCVPTS